MNNGPIYTKSFDFSLKILALYQLLISKKEFVISKQLLRCGTSIGANVNEASAGQTKKDFIAKMAIASKEARETLYWLKLLKESNFLEIDYSSYILLCEELIRILTAIVKTSQTKH
jgi:four helix bundle protein